MWGTGGGPWSTSFKDERMHPRSLLMSNFLKNRFVIGFARLYFNMICYTSFQLKGMVHLPWKVELAKYVLKISLISSCQGSKGGNWFDDRFISQ